MLAFPKAKINLGLFITGMRSDGYHNIDTIFYPVNLCDALEVVVNTREPDGDILILTGYKVPGRLEDNIVFRAIDALRSRFQIPFLRIHLHKKIPPGAGLGGGSSDAACILRVMKRMFGLSISTDELIDIAAGLGSDCPFFIDCRPAIASGKGEILKPVDYFLSGHYVVLVNPGIPVSTKEAYDNCVPSPPKTSLAELITKPISEWKELIINDFEKTISVRHPNINTIKDALYDAGALYSSMSGSGSAVYGIFSEKPVIPDNLKKQVIYNGEL